MLAQARGLDEEEDPELVEQSHKHCKIPEAPKGQDPDTGSPDDDILDYEFTKGQDLHTLAQEHYHSLVNGQLAQSLDQTDNWEIVSHQFQDGELTLQCKELRSGMVVANILYEDCRKDLPDSLARYIRDNGMGR